MSSTGDVESGNPEGGAGDELRRKLQARLCSAGELPADAGEPKEGEGESGGAGSKLVLGLAAVGVGLAGAASYVWSWWNGEEKPVQSEAPVLSGRDAYSVQLAWAPSTVEGASYFLMQEESAKTDVWNEVDIVKSNACLVQGLDPGTAYRFNVVTVSPEGDLVATSGPCAVATLTIAEAEVMRTTQSAA
jgi:hypothetical protein